MTSLVVIFSYDVYSKRGRGNIFFRNNLSQILCGGQPSPQTTPLPPPPPPHMHTPLPHVHICPSLFSCWIVVLRSGQRRKSEERFWVWWMCFLFVTEKVRVNMWATQRSGCWGCSTVIWLHLSNFYIFFSDFPTFPQPTTYFLWLEMQKTKTLNCDITQINLRLLVKVGVLQRLQRHGACAGSCARVGVYV